MSRIIETMATMRLTSIIICVTFNLLTVEVLTSFKAVTSPNGEKLCAVDVPSEVALNVRSVIQCGAICLSDDVCEAYNFKKDREECDLYDCRAPQNYSPIPSCSSYKGSRPSIRDCSDVKRTGRSVSGVNKVCVNGSVVKVYCDMQTDGGGWLVFQRRMNGQIDFYRNWSTYASGFGSLTGEFWLGNENLNLLTSAKRNKLRIEMSTFDGRTSYAEYDNFIVSSSADKYRLVSTGTYSGTAGDSLAFKFRSYDDHLGQQFSTYDKDNDQANYNCAATYKGAWWYNACHASNLNGYYFGGPHSSFADGVEWYTWTGYYYSLKTTEMKIRPF